MEQNQRVSWFLVPLGNDSINLLLHGRIRAELAKSLQFGLVCEPGLTRKNGLLETGPKSSLIQIAGSLCHSHTAILIHGHAIVHSTG